MTVRDRFEDFTERANAEPGAVRELAGIGRYVTVNPMADESELLAELDIPASSCTKVDLYWEFGGDVRFVQVQAEAYAAARSPGIYVRRTQSGYVNLVIVSEAARVTSDVVADALRSAAGAEIDDRLIGSDLTPL